MVVDDDPDDIVLHPMAFEHGSPRRFDLVVGADGLHSGVRAGRPSGMKPGSRTHWAAI
jgi:2-polyprenyl-6-methoxyphenol hydroxylase-like FAD-dependent oxidoreductase